ncbi:HNH endonuclease signature motif containing protein [Flexivirga oryzae]|uniref:HNH nuclease domain-containing protein n=1 Tax=Flexivirga oryzae TaxID=1794944 RepID=A0A839N763_9MICO|nr:HNH endonuclease signature motif containing protein [Flexivirga oryzae]MBB2891476.1 hypothetical protein [Flexivirga oryzae]
MLKTEAQIETEFNDLLQRLYPPDPDDHDDECDPDDYRDDRDDWQHHQQHEHQRDCDTTTRSPGQSPPAPATPPASSLQPAVTAWLGDATVPGVGIIPATIIQELSRSFGATITRALLDADTGVTIATSNTHYRPSTKLAAFVRARDVHCRFPGCTRPARWCDIDHVTPWPAGDTTPTNLHCLCRHHHRAKHSTGWSVTMTPDGVCTWTTPTGRTHTTTPAE